MEQCNIWRNECVFQWRNQVTVLFYLFHREREFFTTGGESTGCLNTINCERCCFYEGTLRRNTNSADTIISLDFSFCSVLLLWVLLEVSFIWEKLSSSRVAVCSEVRGRRQRQLQRRRIRNLFITNCGIIEGFPALRKAVTTHVNKITITFYFTPISCWLESRGQVDKWMAKPSLLSIHGCLFKCSRIMAAKILKNPYRL